MANAVDASRDPSMELWTWTLAVGVCGLLCYYFKRKLGYFEEWGIPYQTPWPFLGNMAKPFFGTNHLIGTIEEIYNVDREAKYVGFFDFTRPAIILRDPELVKSVTIKNFEHFPNHRLVVDEDIEPLFANNLFGLRDDKWREARNLLSPAFTSSKIKAMYELASVCARSFVRHLAERPRPENQMVATKSLFARYTNDVIATCAFGISVDSLREPENEFFVRGKEATKLDGVQTLKFFCARMVPWLMKALQVKFVNRRASEYFRKVIATTVATRDEQGIRRQDMLQLMMDARARENKYLKLDVDEMTAQAFVFFFGGFDTTSNHMCAMAHELAINPEVQARLQEEIDGALGRAGGADLGYEAINGLAYLDAVFNETLRRHMQIAFLDRLCSKEFELPPAKPGAKPFAVRPGMNVFIPVTAIQKDPKHYENPLEFDPERYYQKKVTVNDVTNMGFGIGPRSCIGNRFAIMETKVLFFHLLAKFTLKANAKTSNPLRYSKKSFNLAAEGGFWLTIEPRL